MPYEKLAIISDIDTFKFFEMQKFITGAEYI